MADVHAVFRLLEVEGPARGLHLNVKKNEVGGLLGQALTLSLLR